MAKLTVRPHPGPCTIPWPRLLPHSHPMGCAFTTELPRLALIVILLPAHGATVTGQSRNCLLLFAVEISFRPASLDTTIYQPDHSPLEWHHFTPPTRLYPLPHLPPRHHHFAHPNYYVCLWLENWRTILQLKCEHKSRPKYNL